jgi:hypothetical protein
LEHEHFHLLRSEKKVPEGIQDGNHEYSSDDEYIATELFWHGYREYQKHSLVAPIMHLTAQQAVRRVLAMIKLGIIDWLDFEVWDTADTTAFLPMDLRPGTNRATKSTVDKILNVLFTVKTPLRYYMQVVPEQIATEADALINTLTQDIAGISLIKPQKVTAAKIRLEMPDTPKNEPKRCSISLSKAA